MLASIEGFLSWLKSKIRTQVTISKSAIGTSVLLLAPAYDLFTSETSKWLEELSKEHGLKCLSRHTRKLDVEEALSQIKVGHSLAIFCGHGVANALLGAPDGHMQVFSVGASHSPIYDTSMVETGPRFLFAFCCSAGGELGRKFKLHRGRSFLGYRDELPYNMMNDECTGAWKRIVQTLAKELIADGQISDEHEKRLRFLYEVELARFRDGADKDNSENLDMQMALLRHLTLLRFQKGHADVLNA